MNIDDVIALRYLRTSSAFGFKYSARNIHKYFLKANLPISYTLREDISSDIPQRMDRVKLS